MAAPGGWCAVGAPPPTQGGSSLPSGIGLLAHRGAASPAVSLVRTKKKKKRRERVEIPTSWRAFSKVTFGIVAASFSRSPFIRAVITSVGPAWPRERPTLSNDRLARSPAWRSIPAIVDACRIDSPKSKCNSIACSWGESPRRPFEDKVGLGHIEERQSFKSEGEVGSIFPIWPGLIPPSLRRTQGNVVVHPLEGYARTENGNFPVNVAFLASRKR